MLGIGDGNRRWYGLVQQAQMAMNHACCSNTHPNVFTGQIGLDPNAWPVVQLYDAGPGPGDVVSEVIDGELVVWVLDSWLPVIVQYNKGGGVQKGRRRSDIDSEPERIACSFDCL
jgi:hypothetical protein